MLYWKHSACFLPLKGKMCCSDCYSLVVTSDKAETQEFMANTEAIVRILVILVGTE